MGGGFLVTAGARLGGSLLFGGGPPASPIDDCSSRPSPGPRPGPYIH